MAAKGLGPQPPRPKAARQSGAKQPVARQPQVIPEAVANRMARRIAVASGVPSFLGMAVFVVSYLLVSRHIMDVPPGLTLIGSGAFFLLGVLGLSYGVLSASWESEPGSLLGGEQIGLNISRLRQSLRALRSGGQQG
jgi:VIT1/CCC1 family predicted Fe2+/Mn2+ transporter